MAISEKQFARQRQRGADGHINPPSFAAGALSPTIRMKKTATSFPQKRLTFEGFNIGQKWATEKASEELLNWIYSLDESGRHMNVKNLARERGVTAFVRREAQKVNAELCFALWCGFLSGAESVARVGRAKAQQRNKADADAYRLQQAQQLISEFKAGTL